MRPSFTFEHLEHADLLLGKGIAFDFLQTHCLKPPLARCSNVKG